MDKLDLGDMRFNDGHRGASASVAIANPGQQRNRRALASSVLPQSGQFISSQRASGKTFNAKLAAKSVLGGAGGSGNPLDMLAKGGIFE